MKNFFNKIYQRNPKGLTEILQNSIIGIAGCGGLGSNIAVSLVRAGIGKLIIADFDIVEASNLNRQHYFLTDIGKLKIDALEFHLKNINPSVEVEKFNIKLSKDDIASIYSNVDLLIEAFDKAESKKDIVEAWCENYPFKAIICGNGMGGYTKIQNLKTKINGNIYSCGDGISDLNMGLCSAKVAIVANMQANTAIELLIKNNTANF